MNNTTQNTTIIKKRGFWLFAFSLWPGCGEMFLGFYKQGISLLLASMALIASSAITETGVLMIFIPVLWFYSFCHVHNMVAMPDEEFYALRDHYFFSNSDEDLKNIWASHKVRTYTGIVLVLIGVTALWNALESLLYRTLNEVFMEQYIRPVFRFVPRVLLGGLIVVAGIMLIRGKKKELDALEDHSTDEV